MQPCYYYKTRKKRSLSPERTTSGLVFSLSICNWQSVSNNSRCALCRSGYISRSSMIGLICMGKSDYSAIEIFREDQWFLPGHWEFRTGPAQATLRQRIDLIGESANTVLKNASAAMVSGKAPAISAINTSAGYFVPSDIDVSPFDNSGKKKVSRTYKGFDGYAPILHIWVMKDT